jgi:hypothetical protein
LLVFDLGPFSSSIHFPSYLFIVLQGAVHVVIENIDDDIISHGEWCDSDHIRSRGFVSDE